MKRVSLLVFGLVFVAVMATQAKAAFYYDQDSKFTLSPGSFTSTTCTFNAVYNGPLPSPIPDVKYVLQFVWELGNPTHVFNWNNGTQVWTDGTINISTTNNTGLMSMLDTDTVTTSTSNALATVGGSDSLPYYDLSSYNAGDPVNFSAVFAGFNPDTLHLELEGFFVSPLPEPAALGLMAVASLGLLRRRRA